MEILGGWEAVIPPRIRSEGIRRYSELIHTVELSPFREVRPSGH
jgi:hypothetical protein